jgi:hypothetical protein
MDILEKSHLQELSKFRHAVCYAVKGLSDVIVIKATSGHIPKTQFQEMFIAIGQLISKEGYNKLVCDLSNIQFYHEPTFDWYFMVWKERMFYYGLRTHRIILPLNDLIRDGVELARQRAYEAFPGEKYWQPDLQYAESIDEAVHELAS